MRYSGYQNILSKVRYDYGSFDNDLRRFLIMIIGGCITFIWSEDFFGIPVGVQSTPQEDFVNNVEHMKVGFQRAIIGGG